MADYFNIDQKSELLRKLDELIYKSSNKYEPEEIVFISIFWAINTTYDICPTRSIAEENINLIHDQVSSMKFNDKGFTSKSKNKLN